MTVRAQRGGSERFEGRNRALVLIPVGLIVLITVIDVQSPTDIHLGPLLVIAPALAVSFCGPRTIAAIGALAVVAQIVIAVLHGGLMTSNHLAQIGSLLALSALIVVFTVVRERRSRQLERAQSVAEVAQRALLRPLPERLGPLRIASLYLAAEDETQIGGDLYTATRIEDGARLLIGDVRGKGLAAVGEAALLLSAFRLVAREHPDQPALTEVLDRHVHRYLVDFCGTGDETGEHFITALLVDIPDDEPVLRLTNSGHPPPLLLREGRVTQLECESAPPLGVQTLGLGSPVCQSVPFDEDDVLLLYTDGVIEARDEDGVFYPLTERVSHWTSGNPETLVTRLCKDLLAHAGGRLGDDAAFLAVKRTRAPKQKPEQHPEHGHGHGRSEA
ncbi:PP2C family protein-serine/threonine phosphatase [Actinospica robiniae]|uniref:PP2C family protein-serine/threonine phosphatase n=1 Tax=Actinospica robiniae TaxID=304901 RepID=UPI0004036039|nr:PP2C family protein-serine/threonine phosphatase [Actinospica robiniae]